MTIPLVADERAARNPVKKDCFARFLIVVPESLNKKLSLNWNRVAFAFAVLVPGLPTKLVDALMDLCLPHGLPPLTRDSGEPLSLCQLALLVSFGLLNLLGVLSDICKFHDTYLVS